MQYFPYALGIWLLQSDQLAEEALKISPWNSLGYGALVLVLGAAVVALWRQNYKMRQRHYDYVDQMIGVLQIVESKLDVIDGVRHKVENIEHEVREIRNTQADD